MIIKAPQAWSHLNVSNRTKIFLGGAIETGKPEDWQREFGTRLDEKYKDKILIFDPCRSDLASTLKQVDEPEERFSEHVEWEFNALQSTDVRFFYYAANTISPITLLEMGWFANKESVVYISPEYLGKSNADITCRVFGIPYTSERDDVFNMLCARIDADIAKKEENDGCEGVEQHHHAGISDAQNLSQDGNGVSFGG